MSDIRNNKMKPKQNKKTNNNDDKTKGSTTWC